MPATISPQDPLRNHLLASLPANEFGRLKDDLETVSLKLGQVLYETGEKIDAVYFPTTAIISLLYIMENGKSAEVGIAGNNGVVGLAIFMGDDTMHHRSVVQSAGVAIKIKAGAVKSEFALGGVFQKLMLLYLQSMMTQISQTAVCNRLHTIEQQFCRWLLINHDQLQTNTLFMTHDLIANMLGVRREGVTIAARRLQERGLINYTRGAINMVDRKGIETVVCECYKVVTDEYNRLLGRYITANSGC